MHTPTKKADTEAPEDLKARIRELERNIENLKDSRDRVRITLAEMIAPWPAGTVLCGGPWPEDRKVIVRSLALWAGFLDRVITHCQFIRKDGTHGAMYSIMPYQQRQWVQVDER